MKAKYLLIALIVIALAGAGVYFLYQRGFFSKKESARIDRGAQVRHSFGAGSDLSTNSSEYAQAVKLLGAGDLKGGIEMLATLRSKYATSTGERNALEFSIAQSYAFFGDTPAGIDAFKRVILDERSYDGFMRALSIEALSRIAFTYHDPKYLQQIFSGDPYFTSFVKEGQTPNTESVYALLEDGYRIANTPITGARLAGKAANALYEKQYMSEEDKNALKKDFEQYTNASHGDIQAFAELSGYQTYRAEFYSIYGGAIQSAVLASSTTQYTKDDVEEAYAKAYELSNAAIKPFVIYRYGSFLSVIEPENKEKIESLSKRLLEMNPNEINAFIVFVRNVMTTKSPSSVYTLLQSYRSASPTFKSVTDGYLK